MNKSEFLEILKDYLKKDFSENEIIDILRDYEEYFVDGLIEGKTEIEIIQGLGSPKAIANELISEVNESKVSKKTKFDGINDKLNIYKLRIKEGYKKSKNYVSEKLTPNIQENGHKQSRRLIQVALTILSILLILPAMIVILGLISVGIGLIALLVVYLIVSIITFNILTSAPEIMWIYIFASMMFIGGQILAWQIYILLVKLFKNMVNSYINWIKTRKIYINASKKKEENEYKEKENFEQNDEIEDKTYIDDEEEEGDDRYE